MHVVMSTFSETAHAETAVTNLREAGFSRDKIGVLMRHELVQSKEVKEVDEGLLGEDVGFYMDTLANDGVIIVVEARGKRAAEAWRIMHESRATRTQSTILGQSQNTAITMPVIGLFPDAEEAGQAMKLLLAEGINQEEIYLIDAMNVGETGWCNGRYPLLYTPSPLGGSPMPMPPAGFEQQTAESRLMNLGIDEADAPFYLHAVRQGGALLIVTTDDKKEAATSRTVMKAMDATQMAM